MGGGRRPLSGSPLTTPRPESAFFSLSGAELQNSVKNGHFCSTVGREDGRTLKTVVKVTLRKACPDSPNQGPDDRIASVRPITLAESRDLSEPGITRNGSQNQGAENGHYYAETSKRALLAVPTTIRLL